MREIVEDIKIGLCIIGATVLLISPIFAILWAFAGKHHVFSGIAGIVFLLEIAWLIGHSTNN